MSIPSPQAYRNLIVWQRSMELVKAVYALTGQIPDQKDLGLRSEMRRTAFEIPTHIAGGRMRGTKSGYVYALRSAYAAGASLETAIALLLDMGTPIDSSTASALLEEVMKMLGALLRTLTARSRKDPQNDQQEGAIHSDTVQSVSSSAVRQPTAVL